MVKHTVESNYEVKHTFEVDDPAIFDRGLPKWPACLIAGEDVTPEQAAEIILKTDYAFPDFAWAGNAKEKAATYSAIFGIPEEESGTEIEILREHWAKQEALKQKCGVLELPYLSNQAIITAYVGGPTSWVSWKGEVFQSTRNIGKWPSIADVAFEWVLIAQAFPFLDLKCQLLNHECCEDGPTKVIVEYIVKGGEVALRTPGAKEKPMHRTQEISMTQLMACGWVDSEVREFGLSLDEFTEKVKQVYEEVPQYE